MAKSKTLEDLFQEQLKDILWAENKLSKALAKMSKKCPDAKLASAFAKHKTETDSQIEKLSQVMESLDMPVKGKKCPAMAGLVEEAEEIMSDFEGEYDVMCAGMIAAAQKVEHYEIASYGTLVTWANELGLKQQSRILQSILNEEKKTDELLTQLAEAGINQGAQSKKAA